MAQRRPVLLTISGSIPLGLDADVSAGLRPRADYRVMAAHMDADVVDVDRALSELGLVARLIHRVGGAGTLLGWYSFRHRRNYAVVLTDGEQVGIPLALLMRILGRGGARHVMIAHILSVPKKAKLMRWAHLAELVDRYVVYCRRQAEFVRDELGVRPTRVVQSAFMVDTEFFDPDRWAVPRRRMICAAGLERRDYPTLIRAVDGLDVEVIITASSAWSKRGDSSADEVLPSNVTVTKLSMLDFRAMYAASAFVVVPLEEVDFQAGVTSILEAMSMGRAVICSRVSGQSDTVIENETGRYVRPGDAADLRRAIEDLLADADEAERLGANGRQWVLANAAVERYAGVIATVVADAAGDVAR